MTLGILDPQHIRRYGMYACLQACVGQSKDTKPSTTTTSRWATPHLRSLQSVHHEDPANIISCPPHVLCCRMHWCRALPPLTTYSVVQPCLYFFWQANDDPALARIGCYPPTSVRSSVGHAWLQPCVSSLTATHCTASRVSSRWLMGGFLWLAR